MSTAATEPPRKGFFGRAALIVLAIVLAYANSFSGPFIIDDHLSIVENRQIRSLRNIGAVLSAERESPTAGRPLVNLSFAVNHALGGLDVRGYHIVNVGIHALCALLIFLIVRLTLELPRMRGALRRVAPDIGFAAALLWAVHPLNTEAVNYLTQRTELLMALFYLLTLYGSIRASQSESSRSGWKWSVAAVSSCVAGMACKESMATAPVMVVLYDAIFVFGSVGRAWAGRWRLYLSMAASWILLAILISSGPRIHSAGFGVDVTPWTYLLNQAAMICRYIELAIWPQRLVINYGWPSAVTLADVWPYALVVLVLLGATALALVRRPLLGFLGAWFFITLAASKN